MTVLPIVVGYDGSAGSEAALDWAIDESARTGAPVWLVYALELPTVPGPVAARPTYWPDPSARPAAERMLAGAAARIGEVLPETVVRSTVYDGPPSVVLRDCSHEAAMLVVGHRGTGGVPELLVGSTAVTVSAHTHCPVVIIRAGEPRPDHPRQVLVGVDGSPCSTLALGFAFEQAAARGLGLRVVRTWVPPASTWQLPAFDLTAVAADEKRAVQEQLAGWREKYPAVPVEVAVLTESPGPALAAASRTAALAVVGSRGHGGFVGLLLGSVSQHLVHHGHCPVAIVRERPSPTPA
ncbi:universal stress protein [Plantactinospora siamensis]|uniref:Universal stress protein n=1 Tax=Plantactinospora siamensis TaxID=555372 RepID=A0ABV6NY31_9ACTN